MSRSSPVDVDIENRPESPTVTAPNLTTRRFRNLPIFRNDKLLDFDPLRSSGDISDGYWTLYGSEVEIYNNNLTDNLKGSTESLTFLTSLFSAVVASFIVEIYKTLLPANGQNATDGPPSSAVRINIILFFSFFLSVISAVGCTLIQQFCDDYKKFAYPRVAPHTRGRVQAYLLRGLDIFQIRGVMNGLHALLHISVFLFFWALSDYFYTVNHEFGTVTRHALLGWVIIYMLLSASPLIFSNFPYNTPMTPPLRVACLIPCIIIRFPLWFPQWIRRKPFHLTGLQCYEGIHFDKARSYAIEAGKQAKNLEPYAMKWLFTDNDLSDSDMDKFLEALPGYLASNRTERGQFDEYITADHIKNRIGQHILTCAVSLSLSDEASIARVSSCTKAIVLIFEFGRSSEPNKLEEESHLQRMYIQRLIGDFQTLSDIYDPVVALRASCTSALAVQSLLFWLARFNTGTTDTSRFPSLLIPIYNYLFPNNNMVTVPQLGDHPTPSAVEMWTSILHDGPLANLTRLAQAIRDHDHVPLSSLPFCWKILNVLLSQVWTIHSDEPTRAQSDFDTFHEDTRAYVHGEELGFRMTPLLEALDTVARGRRLLRVISGSDKYFISTDVVFGKEYLRNGELLEAFARCLPDFIANNSSYVCMGHMEKVVNRDYLWTSLQVSLWNTQRLDSPIPDKHRIFENCCTVLDLSFSILEDSQEVDWRAPEFGSLLNHFESFISHCFQGSFMGRATSFRVSIIKARFCKTLLSRFKADIDREGTVSFQSQWDVASLAKLVGILGLQDKEDPEFWNSYVNGGQIGLNFTSKALEMIDIAARDGPLLVFCQLGHLVVTAVPLNQSGLKPMDMEKVLDLQMKVVKDKRLPLIHASDIVWERLGQLRELVNRLWVKRTGEDRKLLERLLQIIDNVYHIRSSGTMDPGQGEPINEGEAGFGKSSSLSTVQMIPGIGLVCRPLGPFLSTIPPGTSQRGVDTPMRRSLSASSATLAAPASTTSSALFSSRRDTPTILQGHASPSSHRSSDSEHGDEGRSGTSPTF